MKNKNFPLTLTGVVFDRDALRTGGKTELVPATDQHRDDQIVQVPGIGRMAVVASPSTIPAAGDISLYSKMDMLGRSAVAGKHTNYGYSGYFRASIFDGKAWRNFKIWDFIPEAERQYETQGDRPRVKKHLVAQLSARVGSVAVWGNRTYELPSSVAGTGSPAGTVDPS